ncbi:MAG: hypothetical protein AABX38_00665 [Candidatus Micrarchaeota archaeon]
MAVKRELTYIVALIVIIAILISVVNFFKKDVEEADAKKFIQEDLANKYPDGDISIIDVKENFNSAGSKYFQVKAKVTRDYYSICPQRIHFYYNYPEQNFVPQPAEYITNNCQVCLTGNCVIAFPEEAIIASRTLNGSAGASSFINSTNAIPMSVNLLNNSWQVVWKSIRSNATYTVYVTTDGKIK